MRYLRSIRYIRDGRSWPRTLLLLTAGGLVPVLGPLAIFGYQATLVEELVRRPDDHGWSSPDTGRLGDYLRRGLRFVLVALAGGAVIPVPCLLVLLAGHLAAIFLAQRESWLLVTVVVGLEGIAFLAVMTVGLAWLTPFWLRAALGPNAGSIFDFEFRREFSRRVGRETLVAHLFLMAAGGVLFIAGLLLCLVGAFVAIQVSALAQAHLYAQLYRLHVERGGPMAVPADPGSLRSASARVEKH